METLKAMLVRHSCRAYTQEQITDESLQKILTAACAAPVGRALYENIHLTVIQSSDFMEQATKRFCKLAGDETAKPLYGGKTWIIVSSNADTGEIAFANAACMIENMSLEAVEQGLGHVYIYGMLRVLEHDEEFITALGIPEGFRPISSIVLGYEQEPQTEERNVSLDRVVTNYIK